MHEMSKKIVLPEEDDCITYQSLGIDPDAWSRPNESFLIDPQPVAPALPAFTVLLSHISYSCYLESSHEWHRHWLVHCFAVSADVAHKAALDVFWTCGDSDVRELSDIRPAGIGKIGTPPRRASMDCSLIMAGHVVRVSGIPLVDVNGVLTK